jgi:hypothetical protein
MQSSESPVPGGAPAGGIAHAARVSTTPTTLPPLGANPTASPDPGAPVVWTKERGKFHTQIDLPPAFTTEYELPTCTPDPVIPFDGAQRIIAVADVDPLIEMGGACIRPQISQCWNQISQPPRHTSTTRHGEGCAARSMLPRRLSATRTCTHAKGCYDMPMCNSHRVKQTQNVCFVTSPDSVLSPESAPIEVPLVFKDDSQPPHSHLGSRGGVPFCLHLG